jgi:hypothetical protein
MTQVTIKETHKDENKSLLKKRLEHVKHILQIFQSFNPSTKVLDESALPQNP